MKTKQIPRFIYKALFTETKHSVIVAGRRTGKTQNACIWLITMMIQNAGARGLWVDTKQANIDKYVDRYFIPTLAELWSECSWNVQKKILKFPNGSYIDFGSAQEPENLEGFAYDFAVINEAGIVLKKHSIWDNTIEPMCKKENCKVRFIGTPKGRNEFYKFFKKGEAKEPTWESYRFTVYDSPFWTQQEIEAKKGKIPENVWQQEYMASFEMYVGLVYPEFEQRKHVVNVVEWDKDDLFFLGLDVGMVHPTACVLIMENRKKELFVIDSFREQNLKPKDITHKVYEMLSRNNLSMDRVRSFAIDPASKGREQTSGTSIYDQLGDARITDKPIFPLPANNDVHGGIQLVAQLLIDGRLKILSKNVELIDEMLSYSWETGRDELLRPVVHKIGDDLVDALRYCVMSRPELFRHKQYDQWGIAEEDGFSAGEAVSL